MRWGMSAGLVALAGCSTATLVDLRVQSPAPNTVQADGVAAPAGREDENLYDSVLVDLRHAPAFRFRFRDGYQALSTEITRDVLEKHHAPVAFPSVGLPVSARSEGTATKGPYLSVVFSVGSDGRARTLRLQSCDARLPEVLGTADGARFYDFPIAQRDLGKLFGPPGSVVRYSALLLDRCRF
jgi:hypothetical protein